MKTKRAATVLLLAALLLTPLLARADRFTGRVVGVTDGDTLTVLMDCRPVKVRLHGIDAPEQAQAFGARSKRNLSALAFGKQAVVEVRETDQYGRLVAVVTCDGRNVNREQVKAGMAWWYRKYAPNDADLQALEAAARHDRRGLWADKNPTPPWEYRRHGQAGKAGASTVYVTPTGRRYHRAECTTLRTVRTALPRAEAERRGYTPCKVCLP